MFSLRFFRRSFVLTILIVVLSSAAVCGAENQDGEANGAMERIVQAAGGAQVLRAVKAVRAVGSISAFARGDSGRYVRVWARGGKLRVETTYSRSTELRLLDGTQGWRGPDERALEKVTGPRLQAMLYQSLVLGLPFGIADGRYRLSFVGKDRFRGVEVDVLKLAEPVSPEVFVFVDGEGHIVKSMGLFTVGSGETAASTSLSAGFDDFREVDGLVLPFSVTYYARDMKIAGMTIDRYELNPDISRVRFEPPRP